MTIRTARTEATETTQGRVAAVRATPDEDVRKVLIAFFVAMAVYLAVALGALAVGNHELGLEIAEAGPPPVETAVDA